MTVSEALAAYDATPRNKTAGLDSAYGELRKACLDAGMPPWPFRVVSWARDYTSRLPDGRLVTVRP